MLDESEKSKSLSGLCFRGSIRCVTECMPRLCVSIRGSWLTSAAVRKGVGERGRSVGRLARQGYVVETTLNYCRIFYASICLSNFFDSVSIASTNSILVRVLT